MKWMGWSWPDLCACAEHLIPLIVEAMTREAEGIKRANRGKR